MCHEPANEEAVSLFLEKKIKFTAITNIVEKEMSAHRIVDNPGLDDILALDTWAKEEARRFSA
jgi:1-deoxy-D-xylulose-5-phosphate reductoisomerase